MCIFWLISAFCIYNTQERNSQQNIGCSYGFLNDFFGIGCERYSFTRPSVIKSNSVVQGCLQFDFRGKFGHFELNLEWTVCMQKSFQPAARISGFFAGIYSSIIYTCSTIYSCIRECYQEIMNAKWFRNSDAIVFLICVHQYAKIERSLFYPNFNILH